MARLKRGRLVDSNNQYILEKGASNEDGQVEVIVKVSLELILDMMVPEEPQVPETKRSR